MTAFAHINLAPAFVFSGEVELSTDHGVAPVSGVRAGAVLRGADGAKMAVLGCHAAPVCGAAVGLPTGPGRAPFVVGAEMLLLCDHFLCAALFGQRQVAVRAGDLDSPAVQHSDPPAAPMFCIEVPTGSVIAVAGYRIALPVPAALPSVPAASSGAAPRLLRAGEVRQLCDAGVLFRHVEGR
jgi:hypothetical protein